MWEGNGDRLESSPATMHACTILVCAARIASAPLRNALTSSAKRPTLATRATSLTGGSTGAPFAALGGGVSGTSLTAETATA